MNQMIADANIYKHYHNRTGIFTVMAIGIFTDTQLKN